MTDIPVTRELIDRLDAWIMIFTRVLPRPLQVLEANGSFHWEYQERSARIVQLAKAVRMASGVRAALYLADAAFLTESASILRMVSDFSTEVIALGDGIMRGRLSSAQQKFVDQYFAPFPNTPGELEEQQRDFYVSREELMKSEVRLANEASLDGEHLRSLRRYLNKGYDSYVHGGYLTAMQLYNGGIEAFDVRGSPENLRAIEVSKAAVAGKLHEIVVALEFMSQLWGLAGLHAEIRAARHRLDATREGSLV